MSSLIFLTDELQAIVATDTLGTTSDWRPAKFTSKAFIVPHLKMIIAGTGIAGFVSKWFVHINDLIVVQDIEGLDSLASRTLLGFWQEHKQQLSIPEAKTTTIYHFGFSRRTGQIHVMAYRSGNAFRSEQVPYGVGIRPPECSIPEDISASSFVRYLPQMMESQRAIQSSKAKEERVYIGGEIEVYQLCAKGFRVFTSHRFGDYARDETAIFDNFRK